MSGRASLSRKHVPAPAAHQEVSAREAISASISASRFALRKIHAGFERTVSFPKHPYAAEIIHEAHAWGKNAFGFDWLGYELEGIPVPSNWWKSGSKVKRLEAEMDKDSAFKDSRLDAIDTQRKKILEQATPQTMNDRHPHTITHLISDLLFSSLPFFFLRPPQRSVLLRVCAAGSGDALRFFFTSFYLDRDHHMALNIAGMIKEHPGARIIVLTGTDHRSAIVRYLQDLFGDSIHLVAVSNQ